MFTSDELEIEGTNEKVLNCCASKFHFQEIMAKEKLDLIVDL